MSYQEQTTASQGTGPVDTKNATSDVESTLASLPECSRFLELARSTGADRNFRLPGYVTVFAPANDAINSLQPVPDSIEFVLRHILLGGKTSADLALMDRVETLAGNPLSVQKEEGTVRIGGARLVRSDIPATNGFVHLIDKLL